MHSLIDKILFKIYIQDIMGFIIRKLKIEKKNRIVELFLSDLNTSDVSKDEILKSAQMYFQFNDSQFYFACCSLVQQILNYPTHDDLIFSVETLDYQDLSLLIRIADSFARFDLGLHLRSEYCNSLEQRAHSMKSTRRDKLIYLFHKQLFGKYLLHYFDRELKIEVPFYLRQFHKRLTSKCDIKLNPSKTDIEFYEKIHNKVVALLAPGILQFDAQLIHELEEFDEIIPLTYTTKQYKDFPLPINISYYNGMNSQRLISDRQFSDGIDLEIYCLKDEVTKLPKYRGILSDSYKWFLGNPNMVQVALYDLLCQKPKRVKIYGMNFFLSEQPYHKNYQSNLSLFSLSSHNMLSNFFYIKKLYSEGLIELDSKATDIIMAGPEKYSFLMKNLYTN